MDLAFALSGLAILLVAGDLLVRGAVALALRLGIPVLIVGLSVVAFGTSAPELLVSVQAALVGAPAIAVGNVVGSNIANILLVLGLPALIAAIRASEQDLRRSFHMMIGASLLMIALCFLGPLALWHGAILLALFLLMLVDMFRSARNGRSTLSIEEVETIAPHDSWLRISLLILAGIIGLPLGADLLVGGASAIAARMGISEAVIGLTLVAVGTSLPELATSVVAAVRGRADVALGNVVGSNLFNILFILGVTSLFGPVAIDPEFLYRDLWVMLGVSLLLAPTVYRNWRVTRAGGAFLVLLYAGFTYILFVT
jgi:cation:H+ antiporter